eukprot:scaffold125357_cov28-Tisochrysis_lutea.AAC.3
MKKHIARRGAEGGATAPVPTMLGGEIFDAHGVNKGDAGRIVVDEANRTPRVSTLTDAARHSAHTIVIGQRALDTGERAAKYVKTRGPEPA